MGTSCNIFVELGDDKHIGVYCHFDGYLDHMLPELHEIDHESLYGLVLQAGINGGFRILNQKAHTTEFLDDCHADYVFDPDDMSCVKFSYIKKLNGEVIFRGRKEEYWIDESFTRIGP